MECCGIDLGVILLMLVNSMVPLKNLFVMARVRKKDENIM